MMGFIAFLFVVFLILSGKYIVIGLFMLIFSHPADHLQHHS